jgi:hypothetical protein
MFAKTETQLSESAYSVAMGGSQRHVVCDMEPGYSYRVYRNGNPTPLTTVNAGEDGIVEFVSPGGGSFQVTQGDEPTEVASQPQASSSQLGYSYPNPIRAGNPAAITFALERAASITVEIYDATGRLIRLLCKDRACPAGPGRVQWDGLDKAGNPVRSGVYFIHLRDGRSPMSRKIVVVN